MAFFASPISVNMNYGNFDNEDLYDHNSINSDSPVSERGGNAEQYTVGRHLSIGFGGAVEALSPTMAVEPPNFGPLNDSQQHRTRSRSPSKLSTTSKQSSNRSPTRTMNGISSVLASDRQPPLHSAALSPTSPSVLARKASSGFGSLWGKMGTIGKTSWSSAPPVRRSTVAAIPSGAGQNFSYGEDVDDISKPSLQDQFSSLRNQEEFAIDAADLEGDEDDAPKEDEEQEETVTMSFEGDPTPQSPAKESRDSHRRKPSFTAERLRKQSVNTNLPPGTASGLVSGPAATPTRVNWDLWQQVVYEGPTAVARTSGKDLSQAITFGIPPAIRGVVWQVLADSKSDELEHIYRILKARSPHDDPLAHRPSLASHPNSPSESSGMLFDKDAADDGADDDRQSIHSDHSETIQSLPPGSPLSSESTGHDPQSKEMAEKRKRESEALIKLEKTIRRDLGARTSYSKYAQSAGLQDGLFGVCKAYALFDEGVGYAQGINFVAMPLLFNMTEEEAFAVLVKLMTKYDLRSLFTADMAGLHLRLYQFERLLEDRDPAVYCHLRRRNVSPQLYATQWFLTLFAYRFPLQLVLRIYDLVLSEGLTAILKFGLVLMQRNRDALLEMKDMAQLSTFLKEKLFDVYIDKSPSASSLLDSGFFGSVSGGVDKALYRADEMVRDACAVHISEEALAWYAGEWEETTRTEREREVELETLRTGNAAYVSKVKALEERVQQQDTEHVAMAQDLVKIKVENDALLDANEALKLRAAELQKLVDAQPAELEAQLKQEMDRIMQRNIEVQNENRHLKEEMAETEHDLVNTKLARAQTQADYDALKKKWANIQALLTDAASSA